MRITKRPEEKVGGGGKRTYKDLDSRVHLEKKKCTSFGSSAEADYEMDWKVMLDIVTIILSR